MSIRWTEKEAIEHGFKKDKEGNWYLPSYLPGGNPGQVSKPKSSVRHEPQRKNASEKEDEGNRERSYRGSPFFRIIVSAYNRRHVDPDNLCPKWFIDELVRAGILPDDSSKFVESIEKRVIKIAPGEKERTVIEVHECC